MSALGLSAADSDGPNEQQSKSTPSWGLDSASSSRLKPIVKKRTLSRDEDEEDASDRALKRRQTSTGEVGSTLRFACPYFKRSPELHRHDRVCSGPGWTNTARLKEHLYRRHKLPISCPRCLREFASDDELRTHQMGQERCKIQQGTGSKDGFGRDQETQLKRRKGLATASEEEKWVAIYQILFPDVERGLVPPPFYSRTDFYATTDQISGLRKFTNVELPKLLKERFTQYGDTSVDKILGSIQKIVQDCVEKTTQRFADQQLQQPADEFQADETQDSKEEPAKQVEHERDEPIIRTEIPEVKIEQQSTESETKSSKPTLSPRIAVNSLLQDSEPPSLRNPSDTTSTIDKDCATCDR